MNASNITTITTGYHNIYHKLVSLSQLSRGSIDPCVVILKSCDM